MPVYVKEDDFIFRDYKEDDIPFLHSSWGNSYYSGHSVYKRLKPDEFHSFHGKIRTRFFEREAKRIIICCPSIDDWHILGWVGFDCLASATVIQYLYVKDAFKGQGIGKMLLKKASPSGAVLYTHLTERASKIMSKKYDDFHGYKFAPHLV